MVTARPVRPLIHRRTRLPKSINPMRSPRASSYHHRGSLNKGRRSGGDDSRRRSRITNDRSSQSGYGTSQRRSYTQYDDGSDNDSVDNWRLDDDQASHGSNYQRGRRERQDNTQRRSNSRRRMLTKRSPSRSALSRSDRSGRERPSRNSKPKTICVDGVPYPSTKTDAAFDTQTLNWHLRTKKLLGGWKVHHTFSRLAPSLATTTTMGAPSPLGLPTPPAREIHLTIHT